MSERILRLKPEEVARLFAEGKMEAVEVFDLEKLRGANSTLQLVRLVEDYLALKDRTSEDLGQCVNHLQEWASTIEKEVVQTAMITHPSSRTSLEQMVSQMINKGTISDNLGLSPSEILNSIKFYDKRSMFMLIGRAQQWGALKALFDIDISNLKPYEGSSARSDSSYGLHLSEALPLKEVHKQMFQLIDQAVQKKGGKLENITPVSLVGTEIDQFGIYLAPSVVDGASAIFVTSHSGVTDIEKYGRVFGPSAVDGYPNINEICLKFSPSFLASVRALDEKEYLKYVPK